MKLTRQGLLTAILVVAALFVGSSVSAWIPTADDLFTEPFLHHAQSGDPVALRTGTVTVTGLRSAQQLSYLGQTAITGDLWLVVDLTWGAASEPATLNLSELRVETADGVRYGGLPALTPTCGPAQPGIPLRCQAQFELPAAVLQGATLLVPASFGVSSGDDVAVVDLGLDDVLAAQLASPGDPIELAEQAPA